MRSQLFTIFVRQEETDLLPRHLQTYVDERLSSIPKIYKEIQKEFPHLKNILMEIRPQ